MAESYNPGDVKLSKVTLKSLDGTRSADITAQCYSIDIFESIMMPMIYAELQIDDGIDLQTKFPIIGEETVEFTFQTLTVPHPRKILLNVYAIDNQDIEVNNLSKRYILKMISPEVFESNRQQITQKFKQENITSIRSILKSNIKTSKTFYSEQTQGIDDVLISSLKPFQAIDMLRRRSLSANYKSSSFCFFENKNGFNFFTLEGLFDAGKKNIGDKIFFYDNNVREDVRTTNYRNLISYEHMRTSNSLDKLQNGGLKNQMTKVDLITGAVSTVISDINNVFKSIDKKSTSTSTGSFRNKYGDSPSATFFMPYDSSLPEYNLPEKITYLQSFVQNIIQNLMLIYIQGDSSITAGDVITCRIPDASGGTGKSQDNRLISGNYLISKLRHMIIFGAQPTYTQSAELIKGSFLN